MKFQYSEKKVKLPENVHAYAEKKVMKLGRYFEGDAEALVVFSVEKNRNVVELTVRGAGTWFRACEATSDMFASIDAAVGTIEGQIRKNKTRLAKRLRKDAFVRSVQEETSFTPEQDEDDLSIVRVKQFYFHDPGGSGAADESAGSQFLRLPGRGQRRLLCRGLPQRERRIRSD